MDSLVCSLCFQENLGRRGYIVEEYILQQNLLSPRYGNLAIFLIGWEKIKLGLDGDNFSAWELGVVMKSQVIQK